MKSLIKFKTTTSSLLRGSAFFCSAFCTLSQAVLPPPDGGYPGGNTAEGQAALLSLTTGGFNTAVGFLSLRSNTEGQFNTAVGAGALLANVGNPNSSAGVRNTAIGAGALLSNTTGDSNTATGAFALLSTTGGVENTAVGNESLFANTDGSFNTAIGSGTLQSNTIGGDNTAIGRFALSSNTEGGSNTAIGDNALLSNTEGNGNTALGASAGRNVTTGSSNVYIGTGVQGVAGESNHTYIRNINITSVNGGETDTVTVNLTTGLLGHASSSRRYKQEIQPMDKASEALYRLKPVTYRYKKEIDPTQSLEYGLVAEDVAEVDPSLTIQDGKGQTENVRYTAVNAMLLNEFLKEHRKVEKLEAALQAVNERLKEQDAKIQDVSGKVQMGKSTSQVVCDAGQIPRVPERMAGMISQ